MEWVGNLTPEQEANALKELGRLDKERQWRMLLLFIAAKQNKRLRGDEYPKRPVADDDPFWPEIRD